ncbi:uncharacterized protein LOC127150391 [Cucumis melo]|uniref:Uncharacterized protein LOC127150391 n=1 Tax=Cucumis melo TaxID=3656 RepID=A0ABM3L202_CUCME|nr:uncharacterized protein LOC127150391 [Cucumis melo]
MYMFQFHRRFNNLQIISNVDFFPNLEVSVSRLTVYWKDCNNSNLIRIVDDKDVSWIMLVISKFPDNDLLVVVGTAPAKDIGNTPYLSSELPRTEDSRSENVIIDLNAFESSHTDIPIRVGSMFRQKSVLKKAIFDIRCTPEDSYAMLSVFSDALIRNNLGTYTAEEADDEGRFKFYFMALAASIDAWNYCIQVISVDGATMENKYLGTLISTCTIDANSQIVPLAFAVVDSENYSSWSWFFRNLKAVFREHNETVIVSDAHKSIENGFNAMYEIAEHGLCAFHLLKNLKKNHKSLPMEDSFNKCARAYTPLEFEYYMRQLEQLSPSMRHELEVVGRHRWARTFFRRKRYQVIITNISESMNSTLKEQRELSVIGLLESIRSLVQKWFYERRTKWSFQRTQLSIYAEDMIRESLRESRSMNIYPVDQHEFEVHHRKKQFVVNILNRTCSCRQWDLDLIPCSHACIALSTRNLNLHLYTDKFYYVSNLINLYTDKFYYVLLVV